MYRVTERLLDKIHRDRAHSCPDLVQQINREFEDCSNSYWRYTTAHELLHPVSHYFRTDQQTQTEIIQPLQVTDTGAQYSSPSDNSDSNSSDSESDIEGTENITVAK